MRNYLILMSATALAACGGSTGPQAVGGVAAPAGPGGTPTPTPSAHSFVTPTQDRTYEAIGSVHSYNYSTRSDGSAQYNELYAGDASTARDGGITVAYSPRDAIFEITVDRGQANVTTGNMRFQDPAHRTDFGGAREPQGGVPNIAGREIQYLQTGSSSGPAGLPAYVTTAPTYSDIAFGGDTFTSEGRTYFYQKPGTTTRYVTYAGYVLNRVGVAEVTVDGQFFANGDPYTYLENNYTLERAAFAYGERTPNSAVQRSGSATFTGDFLATLVFNPDLDISNTSNTYFQWITGSATHNVDFGTLGVLSSFTGTVGPLARDAYSDGINSLPNGSTFTASSTATIDLAGTGGFIGSFNSAAFTRPTLPGFTLNIAGSSIDGAFFGPAAEEIGGGFRIVGGTPDERIDILGAFTAKK